MAKEGAKREKTRKEETAYILLSLFGLQLRTKNKKLADFLTRRVTDAYEISILIGIISFLLALGTRVFDVSLGNFNASSFLKLTNTVLLFAIAFALSLFLGKRE